MLAAVEKARINARLCDITGGKVAGFTKIKAIHEFVGTRGCGMAKLDKRAVTAALGLDIDGTAREVLELRQAAASNAEAKYEAMQAAGMPDRRGSACWLRHARPEDGLVRVRSCTTCREAGEHAGEAIAAILAGDLEAVAQPRLRRSK